jgi:IS1 family transposase
MEKLPTAKRAAVLRCLIEGNSILSTSRIVGVAKNTIIDYLEEAGEACNEYQSKVMVDLPCKELQLDEVWSFVGCKEKNKASAINEHPGDVWTWTAICADTKLIPSWRVGDRGWKTAWDFCHDLAGRFSGHLQISTDGHPSYRFAVGQAFGDVDFAQLIKIYGKDGNGNDVCVGARKVRRRGNPDMSCVSTSYVERSNLTVRMTNRRFTRLTNGFSKKLENHNLMLAVCFMSYNFCRNHGTLKMTPAQAAGIADKQWTLEDVADMIEAHHAEKAEASFEAAFAEMKWTAPRREPKAYEPRKPLTPWYLNKDSGGPNSAVQKAGITYASDLS